MYSIIRTPFCRAFMSEGKRKTFFWWSCCPSCCPASCTWRTVDCWPLRTVDCLAPARATRLGGCGWKGSPAGAIKPQIKHQFPGGFLWYSMLLEVLSGSRSTFATLCYSSRHFATFHPILLYSTTLCYDICLVGFSRNPLSKGVALWNSPGIH